MRVGEQCGLRSLPEGATYDAVVRSVDEPLIEVELRSGAEEFQPGVLVEAAAGDEIYLGVVVERDQQNRIRLEVEHYLNRQTSAALQLAWKKSTQSVA